MFIKSLNDVDHCTVYGLLDMSIEFFMAWFFALLFVQGLSYGIMYLFSRQRSGCREKTSEEEDSDPKNWWST